MSSRKTGPDVNLNLNVRGLAISATLAIQERSNQLRAEGRHIYRLGLGQSPFPVPHVVTEALKNNAHQKDYLPVRGLRALRDAVADYHSSRCRIGVSGADVMIGPGSKELMFILQLVYYGDLIIPSPSWVSHAPQAQIIGRKVRWIPTFQTNQWKLTAKELENICLEDPDRPRIVILNYPNNPTGITYSANELKKIARIARRYRIIVLSDEIYGELHHTGQHTSIASFYPEGTIISSGLSKWCGAGGWRLGTFTFPRQLRWLLDAMAAVASETYTSTSTPIQHAAVRAFKGGMEIERYLVDSRRILYALSSRIVAMLHTSGIKLCKPEGGFYMFPDFSPLAEKLARQGISTSQQLCTKLLEDTGVATLPGAAFGRPPNELTVRVAYVDFDGAQALAQAEQVSKDSPLNENMLNTCCTNTLEAFEKILEWLNCLF